MGILDIIADQRIFAKEKLTSGRLLLKGEEDLYRSHLGLTKRRKRTGERKKYMAEATKGTITSLAALIEGFNIETANKREIRELRKALGALSKEKYPKKAKKEKKVKVAKEKK